MANGLATLLGFQFGATQFNDASELASFEVADAAIEPQCIFPRLANWSALPSPISAQVSP